MKHTKRLLTLISALCMAMSMMMLSASAAGIVDLQRAEKFLVRCTHPTHSHADHIYVAEVYGDGSTQSASSNVIKAGVRIYTSFITSPDLNELFFPDGHESGQILTVYENHNVLSFSSMSGGAAYQRANFLDMVIPGMWYYQTGNGYKACSGDHVYGNLVGSDVVNGWRKFNVSDYWDDVPFAVDVKAPTVTGNEPSGGGSGGGGYYTHWPDNEDPYGTTASTTTPPPKKQPKTGVADSLPLWVSAMSLFSGAYILTFKKKDS